MTAHDRCHMTQHLGTTFIVSFGEGVGFRVFRVNPWCLQLRLGSWCKSRAASYITLVRERSRPRRLSGHESSERSPLSFASIHRFWRQLLCGCWGARNGRAKWTSTEW